MALIRMCVVPNCSQQLSRPILWIVAVCSTYCMDTLYCCVSLTGRVGPPSATTHPRRLPPTPTTPPAQQSHSVDPLVFTKQRKLIDNIASFWNTLKYRLQRGIRYHLSYAQLRVMITT